MYMFFNRFFKQLRSNIITGVLLIIPLFVTILIIVQLFQWIDSALPGILRIDLPPGLGIVFTLIIAYFAGIAAKNYFGKKLIAVGNGIISNIPILNKIYFTIQQVVDMVSSNKNQVFERAVLIEYPRPNCYCIALVTSRANTNLSMKVNQKLVAVLVPQSPPASAFLLYVAESELIEIDLPVESALKLVVSGGLLGADNAAIAKPTNGIRKNWKWTDLFNRKKYGKNLADPRD
jgi:uncharacterized membrane protein